MIRHHYQIELLEDIVITRLSANDANHQTMDYLPGSLWLGVLAPRIGFDPEWALSGKIRFHNAYPLSAEGTPAWPIPFTYHHLKSQTSGDSLIDGLAALQQSDQQLVQVRRGFVTDQGCRVTVATRSSVKTSIDRERFGTARESLLFDYQSIVAGSRFLLTVEAQDSMKPFMSQLDQHLTTGTLLVGRSRSAEYGKVRIMRDTGSYSDPEPIPSQNLIVVYFASDSLILKDGAPTLSPVPADLGLPEGQVDASRSYVRTRTYAQWNAHYNCRMTERQTIVAGSVITVAATKPLGAQELLHLQNTLSHGIGMYRSEGLGRVFLNPPWVIQPPTKLLSAIVSKTSQTDGAQPTQAAQPNTSLATYLIQKYINAEVDPKARQVGQSWAKEFSALSDSLKANQLEPPTKSQWGRVRALCSSEKSLNDLKAKLAAECAGVDPQNTRSVRQRMWTAESKLKDRRFSMYDLMIERLNKCATEAEAIRALYHAANLTIRQLKR